MKNITTPRSFRLKAATVAVAMCFASPAVWANPTGATVVNGTVNFATNGNTLSITNTPGAILNWQQFNIGKGQTTEFIQQSARSTVLNQVLSNQPSQILGTLRSNGQVFLINQAGIMFGVGSVVDVNGLIASTLNISNADFLLNRLNFTGRNGTSVLNQGSITTPLGGRVYLIGNNVTNEGVITTPQGNVVLAAGQSVSLVDTITPHVSVTISAPVGGQAVNLGNISAQGGSIDVYAALIQQQGVLRADSAGVDAQGRIVLSATQSTNLAQGSVTSANGVLGGKVVVQSGGAGSTTVAGTISAAGTTGQGGDIRILGDQVTLTDNAQVDASGDSGGGVVLVGGDFQGKNTAVQNATTTYVAQGASIHVDARNAGNGGQSVVWANDTTTFLGHISARGGVQSGQGGKVEVSGKRVLAFKGAVDTRAPNGQMGTTLLDPKSLCVVMGTTWSGCTSFIDPGQFSTGTTGWFLQSDAGDLTIIDPISLVAGTGSMMTLEALGGNVLTLSANQATLWKTQHTLTTAGTTVNVNLGGQIFTNGANLLLHASNIDSTGAVIAGTGEVHISNAVSTNGGSFMIKAAGAASIDGGGLPLAVAAGNFTSGVYTGGGAIDIGATDFVLGWDQRTGMTLNTPTVLNTNWGGTGSPVWGAVSIHTANGAAGSTGVLLESGSTIFSGFGKVSLSGYNFGNPSGAAGGARIASWGQTLLSFDHLDTSRLEVLSSSLALTPFTRGKSVYLGLSANDARCLVDLCLFPSGGSTLGMSLMKGVVIGSEGNITVGGNVALDGNNNQYALVALNDIILNGTLSVTTPFTLTNVIPQPNGIPLTTTNNVAAPTNLALIAGNNVINNAGARALNLPVGHGWSLFAKDQTTTVLNGLTATTLVNLAQDPLVFTPAMILSILNQPGKTGGNAANSAISNPALLQLLAGLTSPSGSISLGTKSGGNLALFWGSTPAAPTQLPPVVVDCVLNPSLCTSSAPVSSNANPTVTTSAVKTTPAISAVGNLTYSSSLAVTGGAVLTTYSDVLSTRQEARKADDAVAQAIAQGDVAKTSTEREGIHQEIETKSAWVSVKRADARIQETEMEVRAAAIEKESAHSPADQVRAEMRQAIAVARRAHADVQKADAELRQAEVEAKNAKTPDAKAAADVKKQEATIRKVYAEVKNAEAEVEQADSEVKQVEAAVEKGNAPVAKLAVARADAQLKKAEMDMKKAAVEMQAAKDPVARANAEIKVALAEAKQADADAQKADSLAKQAEEQSKTVGSPMMQRLADTKKVEAEAKLAHAEMKQAEVAVKTAQDPIAKAAAEEKVAIVAVRKAEAEVHVAEDKAKTTGTVAAKLAVAVKQVAVEEKKIEVALKAEKDVTRKAEVEVKLADVRAQKAEAEAVYATQEAKEARENAQGARSADAQQLALKQADAREAAAVAKRSESEARKSEAEVKRLEVEVKQIESDSQAAKTPAQRAAAENRLASKRGELDNQRTVAEQKDRKTASLASEANQKEGEYRTAKGRHEEKVLAAFDGIDVTSMGRGRVQELMKLRHEFLKEKLGHALKLLSSNPSSADLRTCDSRGGDECLRPLATVAQFTSDVMARIKLPMMTPITSFLPEIQRKVAVVIGNNAYQDPDIPSLNGAVRDADAVAKVLKEKMGYDVRMIHNGTRADIVRTLNEVADETGSKDSVVVYYAGHGYEMEETKMGYWIPTDASTSTPDNWISNTDINKMLSNIPAKQMLVMSDSCFSGSLTNEEKVMSSVTSTETPAQILGKRSVLVMSSGGEEPVMDEGREGHSIFAWHLIDKLNQLSSYEHGAEVFDAVKAGVGQDGIPQIPQYGASVSAGHRTGGDYLFEVRKY